MNDVCRTMDVYVCVYSQFNECMLTMYVEQWMYMYVSIHNSMSVCERCM